MKVDFTLGKTTYSSVSRAEFKKIQDNAIKEWHFERCSGGVKPVVGKFDPTNQAHIKRSKVVWVYP